MTLQEVYKKGTEMLQEAGIDNPSVDAFYLLEYAAGIDRKQYLLYKDQDVPAGRTEGYFDLIRERMKRIPYQYIISRADFAGLTFEVNPSVLIPRLDTEVLFEQTLRHLGPKAYILDLCTGSGALGIALKRYRPDIRVVMSDISKDALNVAAMNVSHHHMDVAEYVPGYDTCADGRYIYGYDLDFGIRLIESDLFGSMTPATEGDIKFESMTPGDQTAAAQDRTADAGSGRSMVGRFDCIVSNPPYVTDSEYEELMPEVKNHEPRLALTAGADGLDIYRRIAADSPAFLKPGGVLLMEIGCSQAQQVSALMAEAGYSDIMTVKDMAGLDRVVICRK